MLDKHLNLVNKSFETIIEYILPFSDRPVWKDLDHLETLNFDTIK